MNENNNAKSDWSKRDVGALWKREGKNQNYLSGYIKAEDLGLEKEIKIVVFSNKNKKDNQKAPDYRIYISKPIENENKNQIETKKVKSKLAPTKIIETVENVEDDLL